MRRYRLGYAVALLVGLGQLGAGAAKAQIGIPLILGPGGLISGGGLDLPGRLVGSLVGGYPLIQYGGVSLLPEPGFDGAPTGGQSPLDPSGVLDDPSFAIGTRSTSTQAYVSYSARAEAPSSSRIVGLGAPILPSLAGGLVSGLVSGAPSATPTVPRTPPQTDVNSPAFPPGAITPTPGSGGLSSNPAAHSSRVVGLVLLFAPLAGSLGGLPALSLGSGFPLLGQAVPPTLLEPGFNSHVPEDGASRLDLPMQDDGSLVEIAIAQPGAPRCSSSSDLRVGGVFTLTNLQPENHVLAYARASDGSLCLNGAYVTGGRSDVFGALASGQNAVIAANGYVFATNPGSAEGAMGAGSVSVFRIEQDRLVLTDAESTLAPNPRSVTHHGDLVYVVNAGVGNQAGPLVNENVQGYRFDALAGVLEPLPGSARPTIDPEGDPAQIEFTTDGQHLVISQRHSADMGSQYLETMTLGSEGTPVTGYRHDVGGDHPFGFRIGTGNVVYLTHGQLPDALPGGISSHRVNPDGTMTTQTVFTVDGAEETCWNYVSKTTPFVYTSAYFDSAVGQSRIEADGKLTLINAKLASSAISGQNRFYFDAGGFDMHGTVDANGSEYLYVLNNPVPQPLGLPIAHIAGYRILPDGALVRLGPSLAQAIPNSGFGLWTL
jgi:6-phosphogluconolactonase